MTKIETGEKLIYDNTYPVRFWQNVKPSRKITKARIEWEIAHLTRWLEECA